MTKIVNNNDPSAIRAICYMIFVIPPSVPGQPSYERVAAYIDYGKRAGTPARVVAYPSTISQKLALLKTLLWGKDKDIFISMPPFRNWWLYFIPGIRIHLDIRDGWSMAMTSGYGGICAPTPFKAIIARLIERLAIRRSCRAITCTPGLQRYLRQVSGREVHLVTNGVSNDDFALSLKLKISVRKIGSKHERDLVFCCAGQFSEYGQDKARLIVSTICRRYANNRFVIKLIGSDRVQNQWLVDHVASASAGRGHVDILERMDKHSLYEELIKADIAIALVRDSSYEFGTKIFDYIALGVPVLNYFSGPNAFTDYFDAVLDQPFGTTAKVPEIRRSVLIDCFMRTKTAP